MAKCVPATMQREYKKGGVFIMTPQLMYALCISPLLPCKHQSMEAYMICTFGGSSKQWLIKAVLYIL